MGYMDKIFRVKIESSPTGPKPSLFACKWPAKYAIFRSEKPLESAAWRYPRKTSGRNSEKLARNTRFTPVFRCFSAPEAPPSRGIVRNPARAYIYEGSDWNLGIISLDRNREKLTGVTWTIL